MSSEISRNTKWFSLLVDHGRTSKGALYLLLKFEQLFRLKLHSLVIGSGLTRWYANNHVHSKQPVQLFFSSVLVLRDICFQYPCQLWTHGEGRIKWERIGRMGKMVRRAGNLARLVAGMFWISSFPFFGFLPKTMWISSWNEMGEEWWGSEGR